MANDPLSLRSAGLFREHMFRYYGLLFKLFAAANTFGLVRRCSVCLNGAYSSTRALPGLTDATSYFQSILEPLFAELRSSMKARLDDFNVLPKSEKELLLTIKHLQIYMEHNLFLSALK